MGAKSKTHLTTVMDVAREAGVSHTTVSAALRNTGRISEKRGKEIREIAERLNYHPSAAAQLLRTNSRNQLGLLLLPTRQHYRIGESGFFGPILAEFINACEEEEMNYHIEVSQASRNDRFEPPYQIVSGLVSGVAVAGYGSNELRKWLSEQKNCPWISIDEPAEYCVLSAADQGIYEAAKHLAALGHRQIAYLGGPEKYSTHHLGYEGFNRAVTEFCLDTNAGQWICKFEATEEKQARQNAIAVVRDMLSGRKRPTAMICHGYSNIAMYAATLCAMWVPQDLSVVGFGTSEGAYFHVPSLTCVEPNFCGMVFQAVSMLRRLTSGKPVVQKNIWVQPKYVIRDTVAAPK